ncbi:hypothetical protein ACOTH5_31535 [Achromobacter xylosoxidans]|uniref:hypothetical protein n=1 Tax=Alcaligenes xylosoxydans xylosoxydans TaxID=85698 RepID=UPI0004B2A4BE|nr:hypothetical protein [Achromobacter xylosoxidans]QQE59142.1 hypothetical protein I6H41_09150 [Achromobacter xylosoxidans]QQV12886.1 hypothetical protein I6I48_24270 [Achromobacter xylosoxidans]
MNDNGILEQVPGQYVAQAALTLPPAVSAEDRDYLVKIDAGHAGRRQYDLWPGNGNRQPKHKPLGISRVLGSQKL